MKLSIFKDCISFFRQNFKLNTGTYVRTYVDNFSFFFKLEIYGNYTYLFVLSGKCDTCLQNLRMRNFVARDSMWWFIRITMLHFKVSISKQTALKHYPISENDHKLNLQLKVRTMKLTSKDDQTRSTGC